MSPRPLYRIRDWNELFETSQSRKYKALSWVSIPNQHDGKGYRRLMRMPNGPALYGAWIAIVTVASKCRERGVLADESGPLTAEDISIKTDFPEDLIEDAFRVLSGDSIGWLMVDCWEHTGSTLPAEDQCETSISHNHTDTLPYLPDLTEPNEQNPKAVSGGSRSGGKGFDAKDLKDPAKVIAYAKQRGIDTSVHENRLRCLAAALCASDGEKPGGLFVSLITKGVGGDWSTIGDDHHEPAKQWLRSFEASRRPMPAALPSDATDFGAMVDATVNGRAAT